MADIVGEVKTGDVIEVDVEAGIIKINGNEKKVNPMAENVRKTLECGGLIPRVRAELGIK